MINKMM